MLKTFFNNALLAVKNAVIKNERGSLPELTTYVGLAIVAALVVVALIVLAPQTVRDFWNAVTSWIRGQFGF